MELYMILIFAHLFVVFLLFVFRIFKILKCEYILLFTALLVPVWGLIMLVIKMVSDRHNDRKGEQIEVERPRADEEKKSIQVDSAEKDIVPISEALIFNDKLKKRELMMDILYSVNKSIVIDEDEMKEKVVPLEEALVVNDTATRRALLIDVLYKNPGDYISQLYEAKANGDTEVVHYAATALTEIQKDYDRQFQEIADRMCEMPNDERIENEYLQLLESYITSGLLSGDGLTNQLEKYSCLLGEKLGKNEMKGRWTLLNKKANADLKLKNSEALDKDVELMAENWPSREGTYMFKLQSAILKKDSRLIRKTIKEIKDKEIFMSYELRNIVKFWDVKALENEKKVS